MIGGEQATYCPFHAHACSGCHPKIQPELWQTSLMKITLSLPTEPRPELRIHCTAATPDWSELRHLTAVINIFSRISGIPAYIRGLICGCCVGVGESVRSLCLPDPWLC